MRRVIDYILPSINSDAACFLTSLELFHICPGCSFKAKIQYLWQDLLCILFHTFYVVLLERIYCQHLETLSSSPL